MELEKFFNPQSIAIIGVSREPKKVGHLVAKNLLDQGYKGEVFFINPKADELLGKKVYKNISDIDKPIDLALIALPVDAALACLDQLHTQGVKNAVIYASGFKETNPEGSQKEELLHQKASEYDITILGPNCIGFINTKAHINTTFLKHKAPSGNIGFVSQSGALGAVLLDYFAARKNLGFSHFISLGNKTILDESAALEFLASDAQTEVIGLYLEDVTSGERLRQTLKRVSQKKPVIILKSGTTKEGAKAAISHTGGLAGDDEVFEAIVAETGAIRANTYFHLIGLLKLFSFHRLPTSSKVLVLSNAGGVGVLLADQIVKNGLELTTISHKTKSALKKSFDEIKTITLHNPIDLLGDASAFEYEMAIESTLKESDIGSIIVLLTPQANTQIPQTAEVIKKVQEVFKKPIYPVFMGEKSIEHSHLFFEEHHIASFDSYELVPPLLAKILHRYTPSSTIESHSLQKLSILAEENKIKAIMSQNTKRPYLNFKDSMEVLKLAGIETVPFQYMPLKSTAPSVIKFPVVAKVASDTITHKTEVSGVVTHISDSPTLRKAIRTLFKIHGSTGAYVQSQIDGLELFMGAKRDSSFGIVTVLGIGGIYAELLKKTTFILHPSSFKEFKKAIQEQKPFIEYISGFRRLPTVDFNELWKLTSVLGYLLETIDTISAVDVNPLFATEDELVAADARIVLR